jgi:hypothetical protein
LQTGDRHSPYLPTVERPVLLPSGKKTAKRLIATIEAASFEQAGFAGASGCTAHSATQQEFIHPFGLVIVQSPVRRLSAVFKNGQSVTVPEWNRRHVGAPAPVINLEATVRHDAPRFYIVLNILCISGQSVIDADQASGTPPGSRLHDRSRTELITATCRAAATVLQIHHQQLQQHRRKHPGQQVIQHDTQPAADLPVTPFDGPGLEDIEQPEQHEA